MTHTFTAEKHNICIKMSSKLLIVNFTLHHSSELRLVSKVFDDKTSYTYSAICFIFYILKS